MGAGHMHVRSHVIASGTRRFITLVVALGSFGVAEIFEPSRFAHPKVDTALFEISELREAVNRHQREVGTLPGTLEALRNSGYIRPVGVDPWGNSYIYRIHGGSFDLYSSGLNARDDFGEADDISSKEKQYSCEEYGVNCAASVATIVKVSSVSLALLCVVYTIGVGIVGFRRRGNAT